MSDIRGLDGLTPSDVNRELERGGRFVVFDYCISVVLMTLRRSSAIHFVASGEGTGGKSLPYTLLLGWWGIPWGPIYTLGAVAKNLGDVTDEGLAVLNAPPPSSGAPDRATA